MRVVRAKLVVMFVAALVMVIAVAAPVSAQVYEYDTNYYNQESLNCYAGECTYYNPYLDDDCYWVWDEYWG